MIHYHGGPLGGQVGIRGQFWRGRHGFVSYYRPDEIALIAECCQSFAIDNGAFSFWRRRTQYNFDGYYDFCTEWGTLPQCDFCLIPDIIDGSEEDNDSLVDDWISNVRGVPVYHLHESLERAERLSWDYPYVALGSSGDYPNPGTKNWWVRMDEVMSVMCDGGVARCRLHGLRMLSPEIYTALPFASADSTNAVRNKSRLNLSCPVAAACEIARRIESHQSATRWEPRRQLLMNFTLGSPSSV